MRVLGLPLSALAGKGRVVGVRLEQERIEFGIAEANVRAISEAGDA
jgi:hypothetical protein